jgi:glutathione S-transferase
MMPKVLGRSSSNNVQKVLWLLDELGIAFVQEEYGGPIGKTRTPDYLKLNPNGTVPTLVEDTFSVWESNAILRYLAAKHASSLFPTDLQQRANVDKWLDWQLGTLSPAFRPVYIAMVRNGKSLVETAATAAPARDLFWQLDRVLESQPYIAAGTLTLADIAIGPMLYRWYKLGLAEAATVNLHGLLQRLESRPAFARHVMVALA